MKIGVRFVENGSLFSKMAVCSRKKEFVFENGSLKMVVCLRKWESEFDSRRPGGVCQQQSLLSLGPRLCGAVEKMASVEDSCEEVSSCRVGSFTIKYSI